MRIGSLFSGVGGWELAASQLGIEVVFSSENDKWASKVLAHHFDTPNLGDIHGITELPTVDLITAGFPCQSYSYAGDRGGLASDTGALWWETVRCIDLAQPTYFIGENVPGLLSSGRGADFKTIIDSLVERGYRVSWRVLDSQWFGVAQRRRRLYIFAERNPRGVAGPEVLALSQSLSGDSAPSRREGQDDTRAVAVGVGGKSEVSHSLTASDGGLSAKQNQHTLVVGYQESQGERWSEAAQMGTLGTGTASSRHLAHIVIGGQTTQRGGVLEQQVAGTLQTQSRDGSHQSQFVLDGVVRRLTPKECERLQGFPDEWTAVDGMSDTQRYKQMGNAQTVPVARWLLKRVSDSLNQ